MRGSRRIKSREVTMDAMHATVYGNTMDSLLLEEKEEMHRRWYWFLIVGTGLVILGAFAIVWSVLTTISTVLVLSWLLIISGLVLTVHTLARRSRAGFFATLLSGILYLLVGMIMLGNPGISAVTLTLMIAMFLIVSGAFIAVSAITSAWPNRGWMLLQGVVSLVLGFLIYRQWPISGLWVIGMFIGIEMMLNGWGMVMLGLAVRKLR